MSYKDINYTGVVFNLAIVVCAIFAAAKGGILGVAAAIYIFAYAYGKEEERRNS